MAQCVGSLSGEAVPFVYRYGPGALPIPNGRHAMFRSRRGLIAAMARRWKTDWWEVQVNEYRADPDIVFESKTLVDVSFQGDRGEWSEGMNPLIQAAMEKARCVSCTHRHYKKENEDGCGEDQR
jgi:hypothetical protein